MISPDAHETHAGKNPYDFQREFAAEIKSRVDFDTVGVRF
jgi:hypothetical protein